MIRPLLLLAALSFATTARADDPVSHRDGAWLGACDNLLDCTLFGFADDDSATLILSLPHDRAASGTLILRPAHPLHGQLVRLQADRRPATLLLHPLPDPGGQFRARLDGAALQTLLAMLHPPGRLAITAPATRPAGRPILVAALHLAGALPVLDWIAHARRHMPAPSIAPTVAATTVASHLPARTPPASVAALPATRACLGQDSEDPGGGASGTTLSPTIQLWQIPCGSGNFDRTSLFVLADTATGSAAPALFATPPQTVARPPGILVNVETGDDGTILTATEPSRGLDDCGDLRRYRWDGTRFRLSLARLMTACHGLSPDEWPVVYRESAATPP